MLARNVPEAMPLAQTKEVAIMTFADASRAGSAPGV